MKPPPSTPPPPLQFPILTYIPRTSPLPPYSYRHIPFDSPASLNEPGGEPQYQNRKARELRIWPKPWHISSPILHLHPGNLAHPRIITLTFTPKHMAVIYRRPPAKVMTCVRNGLSIVSMPAPYNTVQKKTGSSLSTSGRMESNYRSTAPLPTNHRSGGWGQLM